MGQATVRVVPGPLLGTIKKVHGTRTISLCSSEHNR
jgi:hypothetical protein